MNSPQPPSPPPQYEIEEVHLSDYLNIFLRRRRLPKEIAPSAATTVALWVATAAILVAMGYYTWVVVG